MTLKWSAIVILGGSFIGHGLVNYSLLKEYLAQYTTLVFCIKLRCVRPGFSGAYPKIYISFSWITGHFILPKLKAPKT